jgi:hypothetical protein
VRDATRVTGDTIDVVTGTTIGVGGIGAGEAVSVGFGVRVIVGVADGIGDRVKVGSGVLIPPDGWKGVGVGEEFGSCVTRIKVGKTGGADAGEAQESRNAKSIA